jgi:hypothetical protein
MNKIKKKNIDYKFFICKNDDNVLFKTNKEKKLEYQKQYKEQNKEQIKEYAKQPITCECGCTFRRDSKLRHEKSKKHQDYIANK